VANVLAHSGDVPDPAAVGRVRGAYADADKGKPRAGRADAGLTSAFWAGGLGGARLTLNGRETHLFRSRKVLEVVRPVGRLRLERLASALGACPPEFRGHSGATSPTVAGVGRVRWAHWPTPIKTPLWSSDARPA
jgi:hypothetical protein